MANVMFITEVQKVKNKRVSRGWYVVWVLATVLLIAFYLHPDLFIVPEF